MEPDRAAADVVDLEGADLLPRYGLRAPAPHRRAALLRVVQYPFDERGIDHRRGPFRGQRHGLDKLLLVPGAQLLAHRGADVAPTGADRLRAFLARVVGPIKLVRRGNAVRQTDAVVVHDGVEGGGLELQLADHLRGVQDLLGILAPGDETFLGGLAVDERRLHRAGWRLVVAARADGRL